MYHYHFATTYAMPPVHLVGLPTSLCRFINRTHQFSPHPTAPNKGKFFASVVIFSLTSHRYLQGTRRGTVPLPLFTP